MFCAMKPQSLFYKTALHVFAFFSFVTASNLHAQIVLRVYGPEEFLLRVPKPRKYTVKIDYYGESAATPLGPVTAQVRLFTDFGTPKEQEKLITVRLTDKKESLEIGDDGSMK